VTIGRDNEVMLRLALWLSRTTGVVVVGLLTFLSPPTVRGGFATQVVAYTVTCAGIALWGLADFWPGPVARTRRRLLIVALAMVLLAACVGAAAAGGGTFMIGFAAVAMLSAADELTVQDTVALGALGVLCVEIGGIVFDEGVGTMLGFPLLLMIGALIGRNRATLRVQTEQARQLLEQNELLRAEQRRADVLDERARLAREIHDVLAHSLGALGIQLQTVKALFTVHNDPDRALEALAAAQRMAREGLTETRRAVHALRTDTRPLHEEVARIAAEHAERHHIIVRCETSGAPVPLPPETIVAVLRTTQEALVNAIKHAPGAEIAIQLDYLTEGIRLNVTNPLEADATADLADVAGAADPANPTDTANPAGTVGTAGTADGEPVRLETANAGYGLTGMSERLRLLHGSLQAGPRGGQWVVEAELPLSPTSAAGETPQEKADR
jgi:signal transduction histidine kinase